MIGFVEKLVIGLVALTAFEVVVLCAYGAGSDYTAEEKAVINDQISVEKGQGQDLAFLNDPGWEAFIRERASSDASTLRRRLEKQAAAKAKGKGDGEGTPKKGKVDEGDDPGKRETGSSSIEESNWLTASDSLWEHRRIPLAVRDAELPDLNSAVNALQGAAAEQITLEDGTLAFQVTEVQPGSLIEKGGFLPGDVLISVNGERISGPQDGMRLYSEMKNETRFIVEVKRNGQIVTLFYSLE